MSDKWMLQAINTRGERGMVSPASLRFATQQECEVIAARYRNSFPAQTFNCVLVNAQGYIVESGS